MQLAERDAVLDDGLSFRIRIGDDVGRVEKLLVAESAAGALLSIGVDQPLTEALLVKSYAGNSGDMCSPADGFGIVRHLLGRLITGIYSDCCRIVDGDSECQGCGIVAHDVHRPDS